jgi:hypothetical protein
MVSNGPQWLATMNRHRKKARSYAEEIKRSWGIKEKRRRRCGASELTWEGRKWTCSFSQLRNFSVRVPGRGRMVVVDWQEEVLKAVLAARVHWLLSEGVQALPGPATNDHHRELGFRARSVPRRFVPDRFQGVSSRKNHEQSVIF